jgi:hypothetical protein
MTVYPSPSRKPDMSVRMSCSSSTTKIFADMNSSLPDHWSPSVMAMLIMIMIDLYQYSCPESPGLLSTMAIFIMIQNMDSLYSNARAGVVVCRTLVIALNYKPLELSQNGVSPPGYWRQCAILGAWREYV